MAPTNSYGQEMVSIYLIKIKITTKFFKFIGKLFYLFPVLNNLFMEPRHYLTYNIIHPARQINIIIYFDCYLIADFGLWISWVILQTLFGLGFVSIGVNCFELFSPEHMQHNSLCLNSRALFSRHCVLFAHFLRKSKTLQNETSVPHWYESRMILQVIDRRLKHLLINLQ